MIVRKQINKKHKIYYVPGLISLICLPLLCLLYFNWINAYKQYSALEITMYSDSWAKLLPPELKFKFPPKRNFLEITLDGNDPNDKTRLDFAQLEIRKLTAARDTINGVKIHFSEKSKYWAYVKAIEICKIEKAPIYAHFGDDLYIFNNKPRRLYSGIKTPPQFICGGVITTMKSDENGLGLYSESLVNFIKKNWMISLSYLGLVLVAFRSLKRK